MVLHAQQPGNGREVQSESEVALPEPLVARGWRLVIRAPGRMFAVSEAWGCTGTKAAIRDVIAEAWGLIGFVEYVNRERQNNADEPH